MSEQIKEIIEKYMDLFEGRQKEISDFLFKHFKRDFELQILEKLDKVDATERIKKAGFQKNLSGWRNIYKNITVVSCIQKGAEKMRFDYKFMFIEEKLDEATIEKIEDALKEVDKLKRDFNFAEASIKVDEMLELIKKEEDKVYNKRLYDIKKDIQAAEQEYKNSTERLAQLEEEFKKHEKADDLEAMIDDCEEILEIAKKLRKGDITRKYSSILNNAQKELDTRKELERLEKEFDYNKKKNDLDDAIVIGQKIIELAEKNKKQDVADKYSAIIEEIKKEIEDTKNKIQKALEESKELMNDSKFDEALSKIDGMLELIEAHDVGEYKPLEKQLQDRRKEILAAQQESLKISEDLTDLDKKLLENIENQKLFPALNYCNRIIEIAKANDKPELIDKYSEVLKDIEENIEKLKGQIDELIEKADKDASEFEYETAISNLDSMLKYLGQDLPEYKSKLEEKRKVLIEAEEKYQKILDDINELDKLLMEYMEAHNYVAAFKICEQIIALTEKSQNPRLIEKYKKLLEEIRNNIDAIKKAIDDLIKESLSLSENSRFKEGLAKIERAMELIGEQDLPAEKKKLQEAQKEILEAQERYVKFSADISKLDKELEQHLKDKELLAAMSSCDLLIQISESNNEPQLIQKYSKILQEINKKVDEIKERINTIINDSDTLVDNGQVDDALSNIDTMLDFLKDQNFPDFKKRLEDKKQEILESQNKREQFLKDIEQLDKKLNEHLTADELEAAETTCNEIIRNSEDNNEPELVEKYKQIKKDIKEKRAVAAKERADQDKFGEFKKLIIMLSERGMNFINKGEIKSALDTYLEIVGKIDDYKPK